MRKLAASYLFKTIQNNMVNDTSVTSHLSNVTDGEESLANIQTHTLSPLMTYINYACVFVAGVIFVSDMFAIMLMMRCTRIPFQAKKLSMNFMFSDALGALVFLINQVIIFIFGINTDLTHNFRIVTVGMMMNISCFAVAALAIDRAIALKANLRYSAFVRSKTIDKAIVFIWIFHFVTITGLMVYGLKKTCNLQLDETCDAWAATKMTRFFKFSLLVIAGIVITVSYVYIHTIARRHQRQITSLRNAIFKGNNVNPDCTISERQFQTTKAVIIIVLAFILLHIPMIIHLFILESNVGRRNETPRRMFHAFSYACIQINSFVSLKLYVGKFKEFKLRLYQILGRCFGRYAKEAELLRVHVYNITISSSGKSGGKQNVRTTENDGVQFPYSDVHK